MLGQPAHSPGRSASARGRILERCRNQEPPVARRAVPAEHSDGPREVRPTAFVSAADLGDEPVVVGHPVDVKAASACRGANDPLAGSSDLNEDTLVIETLRGPGHA